MLQRLPLLDVAMSGVWAKVEAADGRGVTFSGGCHASCDYLNRGLGQWEPLLERWGCGMWVRTDVALGDLVTGVPGRVEAEIGSGEHLNVSVSCAMFDVVMGVLAKDAKRWLSARTAARAVAEQPAASSGKDMRSGEAFHPLWIKNETGQLLVLESAAGPLPAGSPHLTQEVEAGATQPVTCVPLVTAPSTGAGPGLPQVSLRQLRVFLAATPTGSVLGGPLPERKLMLHGQVDLDVTGRQVICRVSLGAEALRGPGGPARDGSPRTAPRALIARALLGPWPPWARWRGPILVTLSALSQPRGGCIAAPCNVRRSQRQGLAAVASRCLSA